MNAKSCPFQNSFPIYFELKSTLHFPYFSTAVRVTIDMSRIAFVVNTTTATDPCIDRFPGMDTAASRPRDPDRVGFSFKLFCTHLTHPLIEILDSSPLPLSSILPEPDMDMSVSSASASSSIFPDPLTSSSKKSLLILFCPYTLPEPERLSPSRSFTVR